MVIISNSKTITIISKGKEYRISRETLIGQDGTRWVLTNDGGAIINSETLELHYI